MTYAGRLDPLASGLLLVLAGEAVHEKEQYLGLDKEYELDVLFGVSTDTHDILGLIQETKTYNPSELMKEDWEEIIKKYIGSFQELYPTFSSRTVGGIPLFAHARAGALSEKNIPTHTVEIKSIEVRDMVLISQSDMLDQIHARIGEVEGDFRQEAILEKWKEVVGAATAALPAELFILHLRVVCGSGAYMRVLAHRIGKDLGIPALAWCIHRMRVGEYIL
jgi:tRNA pseudouridine(55) synthase